MLICKKHFYNLIVVEALLLLKPSGQKLFEKNVTRIETNFFYFKMISINYFKG